MKMRTSNVPGLRIDPEDRVRHLRRVAAVAVSFSIGLAFASGYIAILTRGLISLGAGLLCAGFAAVGVTRLHIFYRWETADPAGPRGWAPFPALLVSGGLALWTLASLGNYAPFWGWCAITALAGYAMIVHCEDGRVGRQPVRAEPWSPWSLVGDALVSLGFCVFPAAIAFGAWRAGGVWPLIIALIMCVVQFAIVTSCMRDEASIDEPPEEDGEHARFPRTGGG